MDPYIGHHALHPELRVEPADIAAREPARVVGFVLDPQPHPPLRRFLDRELHLVHVLRGKVLRLAPPRRKVHHEDPIGRKLVEIPDDSRPDLLGVGPVPTRERLNRPVFVRRRLEVRRNLAQRRRRDLLPRPLRRQNRGQQRNHGKRNQYLLHLRLHRNCILSANSSEVPDAQVANAMLYSEQEAR